MTLALLILHSPINNTYTQNKSSTKNISISGMGDKGAEWALNKYLWLQDY